MEVSGIILYYTSIVVYSHLLSHPPVSSHDVYLLSRTHVILPDVYAVSMFLGLWLSGRFHVLREIGDLVNMGLFMYLCGFDNTVNAW